MFELLLDTYQKKGYFGPTTLAAGTTTAGFYGEVDSSQFITGSQLAAKVNLTAGTAFNDTDPWLKFAIDGKILLVAKRPFRNSLSWNNLNDLGILKGTKRIKIKGRTFILRCIRGADADPAKANHNTSNPSGSTASEWQRLLENVCADSSGTAGWASYTSAQLGVTAQTTGSSTLCLEASSWNQSNSAVSGYIVLRGYNGIQNYYVTIPTNATAYSGWRPVLELVGT